MAESSVGAGGQERLRGLGDVPYAWAEDAPRDEVLVGLSEDGTGWEPVSSRDFLALVAGVAKGLIGVGVGAGDRIVVVARPGVACAVVVLAAWVVRAAVVVLAPGVSAERLGYVLRDCDPAAVVLEDGRHAATVGALGRELSDLARVWRLDQGGLESIARPGAYMDSTAVRFRREEQSPSDVAAVVYPVSTVVRTRGVVLTHGGVLAAAEAVVERLSSAARDERRRGEREEPGVGRVLVELGLWEAGALPGLVACALTGASVGFVSWGPRMRREVRTFAPRVLVCRPWLVDRVYQAERSAAPRNGWDNVDSFNLATELAVEYDKAQRKGAWRRMSRAMYEWVFSRVREALGGRVRLVVCVGGGLSERLERFFNGAGVPLVQAWGTPESGGVVTAGSPQERRVQTVGRALAGVEVRPSGDGEVYVRGPWVFGGYWGDEEATRSALWEGWLATGVAGSLDESGFVALGRRLRAESSRSGVRGRPGARASGAAEAEPDHAAVWEQRACAHPLVAQAMVIGRGRPYASALVTLAGDQVEYWRLVNNRPLSMTRAELAADADLGAEIRSAVVAANHAVPAEWAVRAFHVLAEEFTAAAGLVLGDGSLRRDAVLRAFAEEIEGLYRSRETPRE
ncbi:AMP-binding protein [Streptomonospora litoralis]|uniref:Long-chain-fatty-acid--CoA ligase FadD15 n=1 Tax=Streptomonospora litoralis TaxID=2498135 RepID=A0A4P6Q1N9_9ACTN|nr:AMP-binding protein [Streptomonospora litoralis]QBI54413.1 Long-chain-fatty-acid--CoA ligase FadD15 [Streptomonospora litoralis]